MVCEAFRLDGRVALIAGDSRFWSRYVATALAEAGADVAVASGNSTRLTEAVNAARQQGRKAIAIPTDMTDSIQVGKMADQTIAEFGRIDILVNASDTRFARPLLETTEDELRIVMDANFISAFLCCQAVGRHMLQQKKGRIINLISCLAERGIPNGSAYCAAMGGVLQLTRALNLEWAGEGVTVNAIGAGWFSETDRTGLPQEDLLLKYLPLKRYGHPGEVGSLVVYLASDATDFLSGQFMYVDGAAMCHL